MSLIIKTKRVLNQLEEENKYNFGDVTENNKAVYAKLTRMDTMEEIPITNVIFRIGQSEDEVDYTIRDNTSISRHHADIMRKSKLFYILDNNSTNHTYVNGKEIPSGQYVPIKGGDIISLSNMNFRFEL